MKGIWSTQQISGNIDWPHGSLCVLQMRKVAELALGLIDFVRTVLS